MRERIPVASLLVAASLANLPVVYVLVRDSTTDPFVALTSGFVAMGLAWAAGFHVQAKRPRLVKALAAIGVLEAAGALFPDLADARVWLVVAAALSLVAFGLLFRGARASAASPAA